LLFFFIAYKVFLTMLPPLSLLSARRKRLGLTQAQLAKESGVSQSLVAKLENGKVDPAYSRVKAIVEALDHLETISSPTAGQLMSAHVYSLRPSEPLYAASTFMRRHQVSQMPVIERGAVVGGISEKTIMDLIAKGGASTSLAGKTVGDVMEEPFPTVASSTPLQAIAELLKTAPAVLVTRGHELSGIITKADLLKAVHG
jgi:predicted transcriptional regulator